MKMMNILSDPTFMRMFVPLAARMHYVVRLIGLKRVVKFIVKFFRNKLVQRILPHVIVVNCVSEYLGIRQDIWKWVVKKMSKAEHRADAVIKFHDSIARVSLAEAMDEERENRGVAIAGEDDWTRKRFRPRSALKMASALAYEAYYEFGNRDKTPANLLITRKFMRDQLMEYKDLRAQDASGIIDVALSLSFLPSRSVRETNEIIETYQFNDRSLNSFPKPWWNCLRQVTDGGESTY